MHFKITWEDNLKTSFFQGSLLSFDSSKGTVHFTNQYFSAGSTIVKWQSNSDYNQNRTLIQLPLLKRGGAYEISSTLILTPPNSLLIKINFYDRSEMLVQLSAFESEGGTFTYPNSAYFYEIELINAGVEELIFESLVLSEIGKENLKK